MNRHFKDSQYYVRRAAATAKHGIAEELSPIRARIARLRGSEDEEEPEGRFGALRRRITGGLRRGQATGNRAVARGQERVRRYRSEAAE